ncbi:MAG: VWA domain-containing protein, partial [Pyrinomonadaceae bacterium]
MSTSVLAQSPTPTPDSDDVVKITTKLVQVDVVVTDKKGAQVRDLTAADFELRQDGKAQKITGFSYVNVDSAAVTSTIVSKPAATAKGVPLPPPARIKPSDGGRVIAIVVDDGNCAASLWGINSTRSALERFVREQMLPTDLVAIYRTRSGSSILQQYTSDKNVLLKAAEKIRWIPGGPGSGCGEFDGSFNSSARSNTFNKITADGSETKTIESEEERKMREYREDSVQNNQVVGTLGVLNFVIRGLEQSPGRKLVMFMSDGIPTRGRTSAVADPRAFLRDVTDRANRGGIVINTFDLRGANVPGMIESRDEVYVKDDFNATKTISDGRIADGLRLQDGMAILAYETGGEFYQGSDRLERPMGEILRRETGYYLLAYEPNDETFKGKKYNSIEVKIKQPELKVAYRSGFIGVADETAKPKKRTGDSELYEAIAAPLPRAGLAVRLSAYFANTLYGSDIVRSTFHVDGTDITFADEANGLKKAVLDVVAVTMNEKNEVVDEFTRTHTVKFDANTARLINERGLVYAADVPVKKPGTYTFRVAIRDGNSKTLGSASQVVTIPDLKKSGLYLSGLTITNVDSAGRFDTPTA